jgi:hypothetical protein
MYVHPAGIQCTLIAANIPSLDAAKITSGTFDEARIPHTFVNELDPTNMHLSGWLKVDVNAFFGNDLFMGITSVITAARVLQNVTMDAGLVTSGVFGAARVAPDVLTTQGDLLIRGAAGYERLGFGVSGQFLKTQGAGANPTWANAGATKEFWVPATYGNTDGTPKMTFIGDFPAVLLDTAVTVYAYISFSVPQDFTAITQAVLVYICGNSATQNDLTIATQYGAAGEVYTTHSGSVAAASAARLINKIYEKDISGALANLAASDYVGVRAAWAAGTRYVLGVRFKYS